MTAEAKRSVYDDFLDVPAHRVAEVIAGVLHVNPRPSSPHARASSALGAELTGPFDRGRGGPGGWVILDEPELHLAGDILVPDLAGWRRSRMPEMPHAPHFTLAPDWICEVVSPTSTEKVDRAEKLPIYAREHVAYAWLINPIAQTLEAFVLERERWTLLGTWAGDAEARIEPFDAVPLQLAALWAR